MASSIFTRTQRREPFLPDDVDLSPEQTARRRRKLAERKERQAGRAAAGVRQRERIADLSPEQFQQEQRADAREVAQILRRSAALGQRTQQQRQGQGSTSTAASQSTTPRSGSTASSPPSGAQGGAAGTGQNGRSSRGRGSRANGGQANSSSPSNGQSQSSQQFIDQSPEQFINQTFDRFSPQAQGGNRNRSSQQSGGQQGPTAEQFLPNQAGGGSGERTRAEQFAIGRIREELRGMSAEELNDPARLQELREFGQLALQSAQQSTEQSEQIREDVANDPAIQRRGAFNRGQAAFIDRQTNDITSRLDQSAQMLLNPDRVGRRGGSVTGGGGASIRGEGVFLQPSQQQIDQAGQPNILSPDEIQQRMLARADQIEQNLQSGQVDVPQAVGQPANTQRAQEIVQQLRQEAGELDQRADRARQAADQGLTPVQLNQREQQQAAAQAQQQAEQARIQAERDHEARIARIENAPVAGGEDGRQRARNLNNVVKSMDDDIARVESRIGSIDEQIASVREAAANLDPQQFAGAGGRVKGEAREAFEQARQDIRADLETLQDQREALVEERNGTISRRDAVRQRLRSMLEPQQPGSTSAGGAAGGQGDTQPPPNAVARVQIQTEQGLIDGWRLRDGSVVDSQGRPINVQGN